MNKALMPLAIAALGATVGGFYLVSRKRAGSAGRIAGAVLLMVGGGLGCSLRQKGGF